MCEVCRHFEGWTTGDALGAHIPVHFLVRMGPGGLFETIGKALARPLYCSAYHEGTPFAEGPMPSGARAPAEFEREGHLWHVICFDRGDGLFRMAVPLSWQFGVLVDDAREWIIKGKV